MIEELARQVRLDVARLERRLRRRTTSGLTPSQSSLLATLAKAGPLHVNELARYEAVRPASTSRAVDHLAELGLVRRTCDTADARKHTVTLTAQGQAAAASSNDAAVTLVTSALHHRTPADLDALRRALPVLEAITAELAERP